MEAVGFKLEMTADCPESTLHVPKFRRYHADSLELQNAALNVKAHLLENYRELVAQEERGQVAEVIVLNTLFAAWELQRLRFWIRKDPDASLIDEIQATMPMIVKKYGFSKLWRASYESTLQKRVSELLERRGGEAAIKRAYHFGCCGRAIWVPLSVKRGVGPVCWHKRTQA
jgi:hypothetical protein